MTKQRNGFWARLGATPPATPWTWTDIILVLLALVLSLMLIASTVTLTLVGDVELITTNSLIVGWLAGLILLGAFIVIRWQREPEKMAALALGKGRFALYLMLLIGVGAAFTVDLIIAGLSGDMGIHPILYGLPVSDFGGMVMALVFVGIVQPIVDSLIFFGIVLPRLRHTFGAWLGLLATVALFAAYYALIYAANLSADLVLWHGFIFAFMLGLVFAMVRIWADSTRAVMLTYASVGVTALLVHIALAG